MSAGALVFGMFLHRVYYRISGSFLLDPFCWYMSDPVMGSTVVALMQHQGGAACGPLT